MKWFFLVLVLIGTHVASACPPGPCNKYRHVMPPLPEPVVNTYTRTDRAEPPVFSVARITAFITSSTWDAFPHGKRLRFVKADEVTRTATPDRIVLVREIRRDEDLAVINVDGTDYALYRCLDAKHRYTSCLSRYVVTN
ncbi:MAG: hypothetical protein JO257_25070 [Deltaproteobacteria bacterium]|nr:hypothetical protein [Deltaproteobacteria bacterium]